MEFEPARQNYKALSAKFLPLAYILRLKIVELEKNV